MWKVKSLALLGLLVSGCSGKEPAPAPTCDQKCLDGVALRSVRETLKLAYNLTLQGKPAGSQDGMSPCPKGGSAKVTGTATSNAIQGATDIDLTFEFFGCGYDRVNADPLKAYEMTLTGKVHQKGTLAVQPSATTALVLSSGDLTMTGTVYEPKVVFDGQSCVLEVGQNGNDVSGTLCGRPAQFSF